MIGGDALDTLGRVNKEKCMEHAKLPWLSKHGRLFKIVVCSLLFLGMFVSNTLRATSPLDSRINVNSFQQYPFLLEQTLLFDLAGVNPLFNTNYQALSQAKTEPLQPDDMVRMQGQVTAYWQHISALSGCDAVMTNNTNADPMSDIHYQAVLKKISQLIQLESQFSWETLMLENKLTVGQTHPIVNTIAKRLWLLGDMPKEVDVEQVYTDELMQGIKRFQLRHGLQTDGVIGKQTLYWLNQSPRQRAVLLARNELRQRIFSRKLTPSYLLINVPAFEMKLVEQEQTVLTSKVIVGKSSRQTPILDSQISSIVLNPSWRVPSSILRRDILPHIRKDGYYLQDREFDVYDYSGQLIFHTPEEWQELASSRFPYQLVQRPGPKNALGKYKFHFDNSFSVYLHGTSEPALFKRENRALSSGCIRIEKVNELAQWFKRNLVKDKGLWDRLAPNVTDPQWFALSEKLPVHLVYWTAWLDDKGQDHYRNDIYHLEAEFTNAVTSSIFNIP